MNKLSYKLSYYVLYALFAVIVAVLALFYFVGFDRMVGEFNDPVNTDALLYLIYGILGVCIVVTIVAALVQFGTALEDSPKNAIKSLIGVIFLAIVLIVCWSIGSGEALALPGYDGTDNVPFWLKMADMFLYSIYFLFGLTVVLIIASSIKKKLS
ncbi:MAG: hypothetical protein LUD15_14210 [Bacteroides sp.]|nr:hypothetical protein [Bacteroides sp.]